MVTVCHGKPWAAFSIGTLGVLPIIILTNSVKSVMVNLKFSRHIALLTLQILVSHAALSILFAVCCFTCRAALFSLLFVVSCVPLLNSLQFLVSRVTLFYLLCRLCRRL